MRERRYSAVASLDLLHLMLVHDVDIPPVAERSAIDYIAAYLGDGGCAELVRDCLRDIVGSSDRLRERLGEAVSPERSGDAAAFPGPMPAEAAGLARLVSGRLDALAPPSRGPESG